MKQIVLTNNTSLHKGAFPSRNGVNQRRGCLPSSQAPMHSAQLISPVARQPEGSSRPSPGFKIQESVGVVYTPRPKSSLVIKSSDSAPVFDAGERAATEGTSAKVSFALGNVSLTCYPHRETGSQGSVSETCLSCLCQPRHSLSLDKPRRPTIPYKFGRVAARVRFWGRVLTLLTLTATLLLTACEEVEVETTEQTTASPATQSTPQSTSAYKVGLDGKYDPSGLAKRVASAFASDTELAEIDTIYVAQTGSTVILKGTVPNQAILDKMVTIAQSVDGATSVETDRVKVAP